MQQPPSQQSSQGGGAAGELRSDAKQLGSSAANRLHSEVDARKGSAVSQAQSVSTAIERAADGLDESAPAWLKSAFQQGAQQIQRFADSIDQKDSRQLMSEAERFARNNPGTFLAACAAAGFAAARVFKAGAEPQTGELNERPAFGQGEQPWGDGEQGFDREFGQGTDLSQAQKPWQPGQDENSGFEGSATGQSSNRGEFA